MPLWAVPFLSTRVMKNGDPRQWQMVSDCKCSIRIFLLRELYASLNRHSHN